LNDWIPSRFAVLRHFLSRLADAPDHFDLLIMDPERSGSERPLQCWRLPCWPLQSPQVVERIQLHRAGWLEAESGDLSGGRGYVERVCGGDCELSVDSRAKWHVRVAAEANASPAGPKAVGTRSFELLLEQSVPSVDAPFADSWLVSMRYASGN
jgi:hypothetical protein